MRCWRIGYCVCKDEGRLRYAWRNAILKRVKQAFPKGQRKEKLKDGFIFLFLEGASSAGVRFPDCDTILVVHICLQYLNPYEPTFQAMVLKDVSGDELVLEASGTWTDEWGLVELINLNFVWHAKFAELLCRKRPIVRLEPGRVRAKILTDPEDHCMPLWDPSKKRRGGSRGRGFGRGRGGKGSLGEHVPIADVPSGANSSESSEGGDDEVSSSERITLID